MLRRLPPLALALCLAVGLAACGPSGHDARRGEAQDDDGAAAAEASAVASGPRFPVVQGGQWGYIDSTGALVAEPQFDRAWRFSGSRALVRQDSLFGYVARDGALAIAPRFADAWHFAEGLAPVEVEGRWGFIDTTGAVVVGPRFELPPGVMVEERRTPRFERIREGGQVGYREGGEVVIDPRFEQAWHFSEGRARVRVNGQWGFIDTAGEVVIDPQFARAWDFEHGLALVETADGFGYVARDGRMVWGPTR